MTSLYYLLLVLFLVLSFFLVLLVLIQKGRGGGLSSAFGGVGGNTAFGAKTGDVLTWATSIVFGVFLLLAIGLNLLGNRIDANNRKLILNPTTAPIGTNESLPMPTPEPAAPPASAPVASGAGMTPSTQPSAPSQTPSAAPTMTPPTMTTPMTPPTTQK